MANSEYRANVPDDWFVDPVRLGVPGVRKPDTEENPLAWQTDSLCAQTDPEAFFPEKGATAASNTLSRTTSASASGAACPSASVANSASARSRRNTGTRVPAARDAVSCALPARVWSL
jgi:WhiB family redox-sensing transcriptional regulator